MDASLQISVKPGDIAVNALCPRNNQGTVKKAVNVIAKIKNNYYLWGNRTLNALGDELIASDSLNIRQLCTSIKKQIYVACHTFYSFDDFAKQLAVRQRRYNAFPMRPLNWMAPKDVLYSFPDV